MKAQSETTIQFSGYPLRIVEKKQKAFRAELIPLKLPAFQPTTFIQKNAISNNPSNWDEGWFGSYE